MNEDMLLSLLKKKPEKGLQAAIDKYSGLVYHIAYGKLRNVCVKEDIEELAGDVFFALYENRNSITTQKGGIKAFLCTVTLRKAVDIYRKSCKTAYPISLDDDILINDICTDEIFIREETLNELYKAINCLNETDKAVIIRKIFLGQSSGEIGEQLSLSDDAVRKRLSRAYSHLRELLKGVI